MSALPAPTSTDRDLRVQRLEAAPQAPEPTAGWAARILERRRARARRRRLLRAVRAFTG